MSSDNELRRAADRLNAELAGVAIPPPPRPTGRGLAVLVVAAVFTMVVVGAALVLARGDKEPPVGVEDSTTTSGLNLGQEDVPQRVGPEVVIAEGIVAGSDESWRLTAFLTEEEGLCMRLGGQSCGPLPGPLGPLSGASTTIREVPEPRLSCAFGALAHEAMEALLVFSDGSTLSPPLHDGGEIPAKFYAHCWTGDLNLASVTAMDADGSQLASTDETTTTVSTTTTTTVPPPGGDPTSVLAWSMVEAERHVTNYLAALAAGAYEQAAWSTENNGGSIEGQTRDETPAEALQRLCDDAACVGPYAVAADGPGLIADDSGQASSTVTVTHVDTGTQGTIRLGTHEGQLIVFGLPPLVPSAGGPSLVELLFGTEVPSRVVVERFDAFEIWEDGGSEWVTNWWAGDAFQVEGDVIADFRTVVGLRDPQRIYEGNCARLMTRDDEVLVLEQCDDAAGWSMFEVTSGDPRPTPVPFEERFDGDYVWFLERGGTVVHGVGDAEGNLGILTNRAGVDLLGGDYAGYVVLSTDGALLAYSDHRDPAAISHFWSPVVVVKDTSTGAELGRWTLDNPVLCLDFAKSWLVACETDGTSLDPLNEQVALVAINVTTGAINRVETPTRIFLPT